MSFDLRPTDARGTRARAGRRAAELRTERRLELLGIAELQGDQNIANQAGSAFRSDLNNELQAVVRFSDGTSAPATTYPYQYWADTSNGLLKQRNAANSGWIIRATLAETRVMSKTSGYTVAIGDFDQLIKCNGTFTLAFTAAATLGDGFIVEVQNTGSGTITLDPNGSEQIDGATTVSLTAGQSCRIKCDGSAFWTVGRQVAATTTAVPMRQTVLGGPVDSSGYAAFGGSTGSTTVTASGTLTVTAAAGFGTGGAVDYVGQITNPSWTGLSTNGTMYLYLDVTAGGTVTTGSTTLAPTYQWGGTYSTTSGQHTYNIQEGVMKAGNGSSASQVYRTFVGRVTVSGGAVTAITWYQPMNRYVSAQQTITAGSAVSVSHNLGMIPGCVRVTLVNQTTELNYPQGSEVDALQTESNPSGSYGFNAYATASVVSVVTGAGGIYLLNASTGAFTAITAGNWKQKVYVDRGW